MRSRTARVALTLLAVFVVSAAAFLFWNLERRATDLSRDARVLDTQVSTAVRQAFDLRSAQQAYVSAGQSEQFWIQKVAVSVAALRESLTTLRATSGSASARVALDGALHALQEFERMDARAREYATSQQMLLAADLIFSDGLETVEEIITALEQTRYVEAENTAAARSAARRDQVLYAAGSAIIALVIMALLTPAGKPPGTRAEPLPSPRAITLTDEADFEFRPARPVVETVQATPFAPPPQPEAVLVTPPEAAPTPAVREEQTAATVTFPAAPDLEILADVCRDMARLSDMTALNTLLERTATVLDASGVMLWVADPDGRELTAIAAHGYRPHMLTRVGTIKKDAENVTAAAFRTGLLQTVAGGESSAGAIAAPLVSPSGCLGVMSAEVLHEAERQPARLAVATIVASQLATLVAPVSRAQAKSEAV